MFKRVFTLPCVKAFLSFNLSLLLLCKYMSILTLCRILIKSWRSWVYADPSQRLFICRALRMCFGSQHTIHKPTIPSLSLIHSRKPLAGPLLTHSLTHMIDWWFSWNSVLCLLQVFLREKWCVGFHEALAVPFKFTVVRMCLFAEDLLIA